MSNRNFCLDNEISKKCNSSIVITGSARSGTTILGKILHSFAAVEYAFEPPTLASLFALCATLPEASWKLLYETYLYEDLLINSIAGRSINCNLKDDSSIYNVKSQQDIQTRLEKSYSKVAAEAAAEHRTIAYKLPSIVKWMPQLQSYYPSTKVIVATRKAPEVFNSVFRKGWLDDQSLQNNNTMWPYQIVDGQKVPSWVSEEDTQQWLEMDELHRVAYYYISVSEPLSKMDNFIQVRYADLIDNPMTVLSKLAADLGLEFTDKTENIISTISRKTFQFDESLLTGLNSQVLEKVKYYSSIS